MLTILAFLLAALAPLPTVPKEARTIPLVAVSSVVAIDTAHVLVVTTEGAILYPLAHVWLSTATAEVAFGDQPDGGGWSSMASPTLADDYLETAWRSPDGRVLHVVRTNCAGQSADPCAKRHEAKVAAMQKIYPIG